MNRQITFDIHPAYCNFQVWDADLPEQIVHYVTNQILDQGFSSYFQRSLNFFTLGDCRRLTVEVWRADKSEEISLRDDTVRAILVPFSTGGRFRIADSYGNVEVMLSTCSGNHALLFEIKLQNDEAYLNSDRYQENVAGGFSDEWCYLTLFQNASPIESPLQAQILRLDAWSSPPYDLQGHSPLNPSYPLLTEIGQYNVIFPDT